jgi:hypothetical protein
VIHNADDALKIVSHMLQQLTTLSAFATNLTREFCQRADSNTQFFRQKLPNALYFSLLSMCIRDLKYIRHTKITLQLLSQHAKSVNQKQGL